MTTAIQLPIAAPAKVAAPSTAKASGDFRSELASATGNLDSGKAAQTKDANAADSKETSGESRKDIPSQKLSRNANDDSSESDSKDFSPSQINVIPNLVVPVPIVPDLVVPAVTASPVSEVVQGTPDPLLLIGTATTSDNQTAQIGKDVRSILVGAESTMPQATAEESSVLPVANQPALVDAKPAEAKQGLTDKTDEGRDISNSIAPQSTGKKSEPTLKVTHSSDQNKKAPEDSQAKIAIPADASAKSQDERSTVVDAVTVPETTQVAISADQTLKTAEILASTSVAGAKPQQTTDSASNASVSKDVNVDKIASSKINATDLASKVDKTEISKSKSPTASERPQQKDEKNPAESTVIGSNQQSDFDVSPRHATASDSTSVTNVQTQSAVHAGNSNAPLAAAHDTKQTVLNAPLLSRDAVPVEPPATIGSGKLIEKLNGSELRVALRTEELGNISIATTISSQHLAAEIYVDKGETARAFAAELPALNAKLQEEHGLTSNIVMRDTPQFNTNSDQRQQQQQQFTQAPRYVAESQEGSVDVLPIADPSYVSYGDGLDVRA